jgi:hypothetical protein
LRSRGKTFLLLLLAALIGAGSLLVGCSAGTLIQRVEIEPDLITPNGDGSDDVARIIYRVSRRSEVSIYLEDGQGERHYLRQNEPRSPGEDYEAWFGGTIEGRMLPDGNYKAVVEASGSDGRPVAVERELVIRDADTTAPELMNFAVAPTSFTPNQDGISDRVTVSFYLSKQATVKVYLEAPDGKRYPISGEEEAEVGALDYDYDGGVERGIVPPPDGEYMVVGEAVDRVGNRAIAQVPLEIAEGGIPRAEIVAGEFWPLVVPLGETLHFTATVRNTGTIPLRTTGPPPGTAYTSRENYDTKEHYKEPGAFRLGVDYEGNSFGREYPYRWALGEKDLLAPGEEVQITGSIQLMDAPPYYEPLFWLGLLHERVRKINDRHNPTQITIGH